MICNDKKERNEKATHNNFKIMTSFEVSFSETSQVLSLSEFEFLFETCRLYSDSLYTWLVFEKSIFLLSFVLDFH